MKTSRSLTPGEISIAESIFGSSIDYSKVLVHNFGLIIEKENIAKTTLSQMYMGTLYREDYSKEPLDAQEVFIHEMTHVWQFQQKSFNPRVIDIRSAIKYDNGAYQYEVSDKKDLTDYGSEQQASIIAAYYALRVRNNPAEKDQRTLYEKVLEKFIADPTYAKFAMAKSLLKKIRPPKP
jgi:hypothetical protein